MAPVLVTGTVVFASVYLLVKLVLRPLWSPLRHLPGPGRGNLITGNYREIFESGRGVAHRRWYEKYASPAIRFHVNVGIDALLITDALAIQHIMHGAGSEFGRPAFTRYIVGTMFGRNGILHAEGPDHTRQRRLLNPAFSEATIKQLSPIFTEKAAELVAKWTAMIEQSDQAIHVNADIWLSRLTLDIIGKAGFDTELDALDGNDPPLTAGVVDLIQAVGNKQSFKVAAIMISRLFLPFLLWLPFKPFTVQRASIKFIEENTRFLVDRAKESELDKSKRDLLSVLVKANRSESSKMALSDAELRGQVTNFIFAGHETTATLLTWCLHALTTYPDVQTKLRKELKAASINKESALDQIAALPYLDAVAKETARVFPPAMVLTRRANVDNVVPFSKPLPDGSRSLLVPKGTAMFVSIPLMNTLKELWGPDADEYKPERWLQADGPRQKDELSDRWLWAGLATFGFGWRACLGYRFAIIEFKLLLAQLIAAFEFSADRKPGEEIKQVTAFLSKPVVTGREKEGPQLPLRIKLAS